MFHVLIFRVSRPAHTKHAHTKICPSCPRNILIALEGILRAGLVSHLCVEWYVYVCACPPRGGGVMFTWNGCVSYVYPRRMNAVVPLTGICTAIPSEHGGQEVARSPDWLDANSPRRETYYVTNGAVALRLLTWALHNLILL